METRIFKSEKEFLNCIENLKKENEIFFANNLDYSIIIMEKGKEIFIDFYLYIFKNYICRHKYDETLSFNSTDYHLYISRFCKKAFKHLEWNILLKYLGFNFDNYDLQDTDEIGIIY